MKNNHSYTKPEIEIIEVELENIVAQSPNTGFEFSDELHQGGASRSKRLWDNE